MEHSVASWEIITRKLAILLILNKIKVCRCNTVSTKHKKKMYKVILVITFFFAPFFITDSATATYTKCQNPDLSINKYCFKLGDRGTYVKKISIVLKEIGYYQGKPTNVFNKNLGKSVVKFQQDYRLNSTDGIVGNETLLQMCKVWGKGCKPSDIGNGCYTGSPKLVTACLDSFKL
jgi:Putative peptidoglycan binding domain